MSRARIGVTIAAPPERVFHLVRQVEHWARLLPHYRRVVVEARRADRLVTRMVAVRQFGPIPIPVTWRAEHWPDASVPEDLQLRFRHTGGVTRGMDVTWHIRPDGVGAAVTIEHDYSPSLPVIGEHLVPALIDRVFVRHIAGRTLATFKRMAESGADVPANQGS